MRMCSAFRGVLAVMAGYVLCASAYGADSSRVQTRDAREDGARRAVVARGGGAVAGFSGGAMAKISLSLDLPALNPQAVVWAKLDRDPMVGIKARLEQMRPAALRAAADPAKKSFAVDQMIWAWDSGFKAVNGFEVNLLTSAAPSQAYIPGAGLGSPGKCWIMSKAVRAGDEVYCWCVSVDQQTSEVKFTSENRFDLKALFDQVMGPPAKQ